jgi:hypothetical protein
MMVDLDDIFTHPVSKESFDSCFALDNWDVITPNGYTYYYDIWPLRVPGLIELAERHNVFISGDDFKSGQTKMKSVLVDYLVSAGIKPVSIVSYNHLGNNDGYIYICMVVRKTYTPIVIFVREMLQKIIKK